MTVRYAIYFSPAQHSPWWEFGARWLGRDECSDAPLAQPVTTQFEPAELRAITSEPRRYGFHATLKAPFRLGDVHANGDLMVRMQALAATLKPVALGPLHAVTLGDFVALMPVTPPDELAALAAACVTGFDGFRAPLSVEDVARRRGPHLDSRGRELLQLYGYPYVLERFRFHLTLSGPVQVAIAQRVMQAVSEPLARLNLATPLVLDRLCLFVEPAPGQPFKRIADVELPS